MGVVPHHQNHLLKNENPLTNIETRMSFLKPDLFSLRSPPPPTFLMVRESYFVYYELCSRVNRRGQKKKTKKKSTEKKRDEAGVERKSEKVNNILNGFFFSLAPSALFPSNEI